MAHTVYLSCSSPNLFQSFAAAAPNVHLTRLAAHLTCQYASSLIHQLPLFITAVLLSHFTSQWLDCSPCNSPASC